MACAKAIMDGQLEFTPKLLDALYKCTLCGACDVRCKRNLDPEILSVIEGLLSWGKALCLNIRK
jgi:heterodisulfide reductase subunit C